MKKVFLFAAVVIAAVAGTVCYNHESDNELSDLAKKNVKALAMDEEVKECVYKEKKVCYVGIVLPTNSGLLPIPNYMNYMEIIP